MRQTVIAPANWEEVIKEVMPGIDSSIDIISVLILRYHVRERLFVGLRTARGELRSFGQWRHKSLPFHYKRDILVANRVPN